MTGGGGAHNMMSGGGSAFEMNTGQHTFDVIHNYPDEVQKQANHYFQQIYAQPPNQQLSVPDFVTKLKQFQAGSQRDKVGRK